MHPFLSNSNPHISPHTSRHGSPSYVPSTHIQIPTLEEKTQGRGTYSAFTTTSVRWVIVHALPLIRGVQRLSPTHPRTHPASNDPIQITICIPSNLRLSSPFFLFHTQIFFFIPHSIRRPASHRVPEKGRRKENPRFTRENQEEEFCASTVVEFGMGNIGPLDIKLLEWDFASALIINCGWRD